MPSRILSGGNSGMQSAQAAKKSAMEDDGSGWINPTNIQKYRSGASIRYVEYFGYLLLGCSVISVSFIICILTLLCLWLVCIFV
jgi:hypothetical protein